MFDDLRYSFRTLRKSPAFTVTAVLILALGIGANTSIFSVVNAVLLRPLLHEQPDRLAVLLETRPEGYGSVAALNFLDWLAQNRVFESMALYTSTGLNVTGGADPQRIRGAFVSQGFFETLRVEPSAGRLFLPEEYKPGGERVAVVSDGLWRRQFGADPGLVGRTVTLSGKSYTVVGILRAGFQFPDRAEIWAPRLLDDKASLN